MKSPGRKAMRGAARAVRSSGAVGRELQKESVGEFDWGVDERVVMVML